MFALLLQPPLESTRTLELESNAIQDMLRLKRGERSAVVLPRLLASGCVEGPNQALTAFVAHCWLQAGSNKP